MARVSILLITVVFLIAVALIAVMVSWLSAPYYDLTIASRVGGSVTSPGEGTFTYSPGALVLLVAEAEEGYHFVLWTGDVDTIANINVATTTIIMSSNYSIAANFAPEIPENLEIRDWYDLDAVRDNLGGNHTLMNDLDSTTPGYDELASPRANQGKGWQPIGTWHIFMGSFYGQGYEIRDLFVNSPDEYSAGLFASVGPNGVIEDIGVVDATVTGLVWVDELVGASSSAVGNSYSPATSLAGAGVGGLVGWNQGIVSNSYSTGRVTGDADVGGLVGFNTGFVSNSYFTGRVTGDGVVGGLVGRNEGTVSNSYYNYDEVLINGENIITIGALFDEDFEEWLDNDKFLDVKERLSLEDGYYLINDVSDFKELLAFGQDATLKFRLTNDLDLSDEPNFYIPYLAGEFDGNGHEISNLSLNSNLASPIGLFGYLPPSGKVTQVGIENINITGYSGVGGLVGWSMGTVNNSYANGSVNGDSTGGLVGQNEGTVSNSYSTGSVTGEVDVGGLVGYNKGTVTGSHSTGSVTGDEAVGGLVGQNYDGTVSNSYATGSVTGYSNVGGLIGRNEGMVRDSYASGGVAGNYSIGGLVAVNDWGMVRDSFWDMETSGTEVSDGGKGKTTAEMRNIATFTDTTTKGLEKPWDIIAIDFGHTNITYIWNIVDGQTYPFLSWQSV